MVIQFLLKWTKAIFVHRKYHRGQQRHGQSVVGMTEHGTGGCWLEFVAKHDAQAL